MIKHRIFKRITAFALSLVFVFTGLFPYGAQTVRAAEEDLILYYDFNLQNSFSTVISDASGNQNAGQLESNGGGSVEGTYTIGDANIYGTTVKALTLTGGADGPYLKLPDGILNNHDAVTISMWVKLTTDNGYQRIWDFGNDTTSYMYLLSDGGNDGFKGYASAITTSGWSEEKGVGKGENFDKNRWVLTTVVMDGSEMSLYENGILVGTQDTGITVNDLGATTGNYIGKGQYADDPTIGQFAEVKIYQKALSAEEIAAMYSVDDAGIVAADKSELDLGELSAVTEDIELPAKGANGSAITWKSTNPAVAIEDNTAKVTRPAAGEENVSGTLTATISYGSEPVTDTKEFPITVLAAYTDQQNAEYDAEKAAAALGDLTAVMSDFTLPVLGERGSAITWESTNPAVIIEDGTAKVTRPAIGEENAVGKLKATVTYGTADAVEKELDITVVAFRETVTITSVAPVAVTTLAGHSPSLPNYVKVTYSDGTENKLKTIWPVKVDADEYASAGSFTVEGSIVGETKKITADVTVVDEEEVEKTVVSSSFDLNDITLDKTGDNGSILTQNRDRDIAYLKLLDNKRMLYNFYNTFGQTEKIQGVEPLGGWDEPTGLLRGHSTGHYMSALALAYASTGDEEIKTKLNEMVHELRELQLLSKGNAEDFKTNGVLTSTWSTDPDTWGEGFLSGYSPDQFALLEQYTPYGGPDSGIWAPYYTLHKLIAGLLDAYTYTGNEEALTTASALGKWVCARLNACTQEQLTKMWDMYIAGEFGGFNESLAQLYIYTGDAAFLDGAKLFDNTNFFDKLAVNVDDIEGRHANQHIPQIIGALEIYEATVKSGNPEVKYYDIAENFWQMTVSRYAYSIGGVGTGEKFTNPYQQANNIQGTTNCETCAAYNMLKLTRMLNNYDPDDAEYMDYYERTLYNQILASQTPNVTADMHNGTTYMLPIGPGSTRDFGSDYDSFTCCHGTGMENHVKYQEAAYAKTEDTLYVGLYLPSTVTWEEKGVKVVQETEYPSEDTKLTVAALEDQEAQSFDMKLRVPYWATEGFTVKVNGVERITEPEISTYVTLEDLAAEDVVEIHMPWTLHLDKTPDKLGKSEVASVMYGPFVMAAQIDSTDWKTLVLSSKLSDSIQVSKSSKTGFPTLTANGYNFAPMFSPEYATEAYDAYFKVLTAEDDGSSWYEAKITNTTPKRGSFTIDADMVKEGGSLTITAVPNEGYMVKLLTVNGEAVQIGEDNTYIITDVNSDLNIEGSFQLINPPTPDPEHLEYTASVSSDYTASWEYLDGIMTNWEPTVSNAGTGKGWGNWPQDPGSEHYVQYEWDTEVSMNRFDVYWYDDNGDTRIPGSIRVLYLDESGKWQEAELLSKYEDVIAIDQYNTITFQTITTTSVKLVLTVLDNVAANGILRWKVSCEQRSEDKTVLNTVIAEAEGKNQSDYTAESWQAFSEALEAAKAIAADENAKADAVEKALAKLNAAIDALKPADEQKSDNNDPIQNVDETQKPAGEVLVPANLKASWTGKKNIKLTWSAAANATKYVIYRSAKKTGSYKKIASVEGTSYTDKKASAGKTTYYKVVAYNGSTKGADSKIVSAYALKTPTGVKAKVKGKTVTISFKKVSKASGYEIYRAAKSKGKYKKVAAIKSNKTVKKSFKNMKKGKYYFKIRAFKTVKGKKVYTGYSKTVKAVVK